MSRQRKTTVVVKSNRSDATLDLRSLGGGGAVGRLLEHVCSVPSRPIYYISSAVAFSGVPIYVPPSPSIGSNVIL